MSDLDLTIPRGSRTGFVGTTGSGKSTTIDLLMGLLMPTEGKILVDGVEITGERLRSWQKAIAHVPQSIFLADSTIAENIAFGVPIESIDMERVRLAAQQAHISDFIERQPGGYTTLVGERGVRLSGGQRQRIGIARALYKRASVLVFDEATSSLDNETEQGVMDSIENLHKDLTVLLIAHRLTTVQRCDLIFELSNGRVVAEGPYDELTQKSPSFRKMASTEHFIAVGLAIGAVAINALRRAQQLLLRDLVRRSVKPPSCSVPSPNKRGHWPTSAAPTVRGQSPEISSPRSSAPTASTSVIP